MTTAPSSLKKGFTLLELLIVISIIGILVAVGLASYSSAQKKARDSRRKSDIKAIQNALEQYYAENNSVYPTASGTDEAVIGTEYLPVGWPDDPKGINSYVYTVNGASRSAFCVCAILEGSTGSNANANNAGVCTYTPGTRYCMSNQQ